MSPLRTATDKEPSSDIRPARCGDGDARRGEAFAAMTALGVVLLASTILMIIFHDRFWAAADEGNYAHVAERLLSGQVLDRDIQDVHAGYINFVNAAAFSIFGVRIVSMRYPLALLTVAQSGLMFLLLRPRGVIVALVGGLAFTSLTFVQFLNPTANWYTLFLTVCTVAWLAWIPSGRAGREFVAGLLVGTTFFFRQLSGLILAIGLLVFLCLERHDSPVTGRHELPRAILAISAIGLLVYLLRTTEPIGWILIGVWPFPILLRAWRRPTVSNGQFAKALLLLSVGALLAALPILVYHIVHWSVSQWIEDTFATAMALSGFDFIRRPGYLMMGVLAWRGFWTDNAASELNAGLWTLLLLVSALLGLVLLHQLVRNSRSSVHPLPVIASFYTLVSLHYQLPIYLFYTVGLTLSALLWLVAGTGTFSRVGAISITGFVAGVALYYQAGMSLTRNLQGIVAGERRFPIVRLESPVAGIYVDSADAELYHQLIGLTERETQPGDSIFALPTHAELYFLSRRTNPFRFYNTALGIRSSRDLIQTLRVVRCHPPKLVFYNPEDKYNTPASARIAAVVQATYQELDEVPHFRVFRPLSDSSHGGRNDPACGVSAVPDE
jgi:hypothetical protein